MNDTEFASLNFKRKMSDDMLQEVVKHLKTLSGEKFLTSYGYVCRGSKYNLVKMHPDLVEKILAELEAEKKA